MGPVLPWLDEVHRLDGIMPLIVCPILADHCSKQSRYLLISRFRVCGQGGDRSGAAVSLVKIFTDYSKYIFKAEPELRVDQGGVSLGGQPAGSFHPAEII